MTMSSAGSASLPKKRHPQQNSLVLENGMLKLCPQNHQEEERDEIEERMKTCAASDTRLDQVVHEDEEDEDEPAPRRRPTDTLKYDHF